MNTMTTTLRPRAERRSGAVQPGPCTTSPDRVLGSGPMDKGTLEKAVARLEKESRIKKESKPAYDNAVAAQKVLEEGKTLYAAGSAAG